MNTEPKVTKAKKKPTLAEAQAAVGGFVQLVELYDGSQLLVNEEGLLHNLPLNFEASEMAGQVIVGEALLLTGKHRWS